MSRAPMDEATLARRAAALREEHRRTSPLAGAVWPVQRPTWRDHALLAANVAGQALLLAAAFCLTWVLVLGMLAPEGCPLEDVVFGADDACETYVKDEAYWNARLGVPPTDNHNDKE